jgi:hypothetical protein
VGTRRTSLVVDPPDGVFPLFSPTPRAGRPSGRLWESGPPNGPEDRPLRERCLNILTAGPPMLPGPYNNNMQLFQTPQDGGDSQRDDPRHASGTDRRTVAPAVHHPAMAGRRPRQVDGDTLVVETTNFTGKTAFRGSSESLHLVERFTRVSADTLLYEFTVTDPAAWARPWSVALPMSRSVDKIYEYACHEGTSGCRRSSRERARRSGRRDRRPVPADRFSSRFLTFPRARRAAGAAKATPYVAVPRQC